MIDLQLAWFYIGFSSIFGAYFLVRWWQLQKKLRQTIRRYELRLAGYEALNNQYEYVNDLLHGDVVLDRPVLHLIHKEDKYVTIGFLVEPLNGNIKVKIDKGLLEWVYGFKFS